MIDDFDFTGIGGIANLFDIDQVEVVHGPQSSAYGATASAGVIKISTVKPQPNELIKFILHMERKINKHLGLLTVQPLMKKVKLAIELAILQQNLMGSFKVIKILIITKGNTFKT